MHCGMPHKFHLYRLSTEMFLQEQFDICHQVHFHDMQHGEHINQSIIVYTSKVNVKYNSWLCDQVNLCMHIVNDNLRYTLMKRKPLIPLKLTSKV